MSRGALLNPIQYSGRGTWRVQLGLRFGYLREETDVLAGYAAYDHLGIAQKNGVVADELKNAMSVSTAPILHPIEHMLRKIAFRDRFQRLSSEASVPDLRLHARQRP